MNTLKLTCRLNHDDYLSIEEDTLLSFKEDNDVKIELFIHHKTAEKYIVLNEKNQLKLIEWLQSFRVNNLLKGNK